MDRRRGHGGGSDGQRSVPGDRRPGRGGRGRAGGLLDPAQELLAHRVELAGKHQSLVRHQLEQRQCPVVLEIGARGPRLVQLSEHLDGAGDVLRVRHQVLPDQSLRGDQQVGLGGCLASGGIDGGSLLHGFEFDRRCRIALGVQMTGLRGAGRALGLDQAPDEIRCGCVQGHGGTAAVDQQTLGKGHRIPAERLQVLLEAGGVLDVEGPTRLVEQGADVPVHHGQCVRPSASHPGLGSGPAVDTEGEGDGDLEGVHAVPGDQRSAAE